MNVKVCLIIVVFIYNISNFAFGQGLNIHLDKNGIDVQPDQFISYYQTPPDRIDWLERERIPSDQWPLLFETAKAANVSLDRVWELHRQHPSWYDVLTDLNVPPSYFYYDVPLEKKYGPPYGKAYGYYRSHPSEVYRWTDSDLIRLASVRYLSESSHRAPHDAIALYQSHPHFIRRVLAPRSLPQHTEVHKIKYKHPYKLEPKHESKHEGKGKDHEKKHKNKH